MSRSRATRVTINGFLIKKGGCRAADCGNRHRSRIDSCKTFHPTRADQRAEGRRAEESCVDSGQHRGEQQRKSQRGVKAGFAAHAARSAPSGAALLGYRYSRITLLYNMSFINPVSSAPLRSIDRKLGTALVCAMVGLNQIAAQTSFTSTSV